MDNKSMREFLGSLHETATGLHKIGVISDAEMQEYDRNCIDQEDETIPGAGTTQSKPTTPVFARSQK
jgi:DNA-binding transcriptional regulator YiaG